MSTAEATATALATTRTADEIDADYMQAIEDDDLDRQSELAAEPARPDDEDPHIARANDELKRKLTKTQLAKIEKEEAAAAEHAALQALVPWELLPADRNYNQKSKIDQWADDAGAFPVRYRAYSREEWAHAIDLLATTVNGLAASAPEFQHKTGLYVEEHGPDLLLLRAKSWQLLMQVPAKSSLKGKTFELKSTRSHWDSSDEAADEFAELVAIYVPDAERGILLDICCQYMRNVRIRVNRAIWARQNPDLAHLLGKQ